MANNVGNPNHDELGRFASSNKVGSKLNKMGFGPDRTGANWVKDEQGRDFYTVPSGVDEKFFAHLGVELSPEEKLDLQKYGTISAERFDNEFGDEEYLNEALSEYLGTKQEKDEIQQRDDYLSNRADELNDEEKMKGW